MRSSLFWATIVVVTCALFVVVNVSGQVTSGDYGTPLTPPRWKYTNAMEVIAASLLDFRMSPQPEVSTKRIPPRRDVVAFLWGRLYPEVRVSRWEMEEWPDLQPGKRQGL